MNNVWKSWIEHDIKKIAADLTEAAQTCTDWEAYQRRVAYLITDNLDRDNFRLMQRGCVKPPIYASRNTHLESLMDQFRDDDGEPGVV